MGPRCPGARPIFIRGSVIKSQLFPNWGIAKPPSLKLNKTHYPFLNKSRVSIHNGLFDLGSVFRRFLFRVVEEVRAGTSS
jgi:hypothetical protein